ncbi:MAG TPA: 50S ribosomal protein L11 methyltransferase [Chryseosolibacter sp.]
MYYTQLTVSCSPAFIDILIAELSEAGFDTFQESETGFDAYVEGDGFSEEIVNELKSRYSATTPLSFSFQKIEKKNWNEEWERNYEPIDVDGKCLIRAEFHKPEKRYPYEIIITPKMSFGTGHHQTTYLMIKNQMSIDHKNKRVMDAGCGTAILAIMASKLGATQIEAFDIDEWSVVNGEENKTLNGTPNIHIQQGKISEVNLAGTFDIILANINKNVLLSEMSVYASFLGAQGKLLLSGFYTHDIEDLKREAAKHNLKEISRDERETWACLQLQNP